MNPFLGLLLGDYRPRALSPQAYRRRSGVPRRVVTHWLMADDPWPDLEDTDLIVIQGVALRSSDIELWRERQSDLPGHPNVMVGLPAFLLPGAARGDVALDLLSGSKNVQAPPRQVLRDYFRYSNFNWFLGGTPYALNLASRGSRSSLLSELLASVYHRSPAPLGGGRAEWREVVRALVFNHGRLKVSTANLQKKPRTRLYRVFRDFFLSSGILVASDSGLGWTELRVSGGSAATSEGQGWLAFLLESLYDQQNTQGVGIEDLLRSLERPPYGVRGDLARYLLAVAASCHLGSLWYEGPAGGTSAVRAASSFLIEPEQLMPILQRGKGKLIFRPASSAEQLFLRSLRQLFRPLVETRGDLALDPWDQTRKDILHWCAELPSWTRSHRLSHSVQAQALLKVCHDATEVDSRRLLRETIPEAFRWKNIPQLGEQAYFIDQINVARLELEGFLRRFLDKLTLGVHGTLVGGEIAELAVSREWLLRGRRAWLGGFLSGAFEGALFSPWAEGLLSALSGPLGFTHGVGGSADLELEERWFVQLPRELGLTPVCEWETDHTRLFLARLGRARLELELGRFHEFFAGFAGPHRAETAESWLHLVLTGDDVPAEVAEEILALVLDDLE